MMPAPIALGLTICEQFIVDADTRRASAINAFNRLNADAFPFDPLPFCVYCLLTGGQGEAELTLSVTNTQTDEEVYSHLFRRMFPSRFTEVQILIRLDDITFPTPGAYLFTLMVDDDWVAHRRIRLT